MIIIDHTPDLKVAKAVAFTKAAILGNIGFCYGEVKRIALFSGTNIRNHIERLERELAEDTTLSDYVIFRLRRLRNHLKEQEREHYLFDERAYRQLRSNFDKLKRALALLVHEGEVESYTVRPNGELRVNWFTESSDTELEIIYQGLTYDLDMSDGFHSKDQVSKNMWSLYGRVAPVGWNGLLTKKKEEIIGQGLIVKPQEIKKAQQGAIDCHADSHYKIHIKYGINGVDVAWEEENDTARELQ
jgi:hypothetical protein